MILNLIVCLGVKLGIAALASLTGSRLVRDVRGKLNLSAKPADFDEIAKVFYWKTLGWAWVIGGEGRL